MDSSFSGLAQQFALACGLCSFYHMTTLSQGGTIRYFPLVLLPYSLSVYAVNHLFLRQSRTMRSIVLLNAAFFTALFASVLYIEGIADWATMVFQGGFCLWITVWGARCCLEPPELRSLIVSLDLNVLLLLLFTAVIYSQRAMNPLERKRGGAQMDSPLSVVSGNMDVPQCYILPHLESLIPTHEIQLKSKYPCGMM